MSDNSRERKITLNEFLDYKCDGTKCGDLWKGLKFLDDIKTIVDLEDIKKQIIEEKYQVVEDYIIAINTYLKMANSIKD